MDLKKNIRDTAIKLFDEKGIGFTLDELATQLKISKKTIYKVYEGKEAIFLEAIESVFKDIKIEEHKIFCDTSLNTLEKLKAILCVYPDHAPLRYDKMDAIASVYPSAYDLIESHLTNNWDETFNLLNLAISQGYIVPISEVDFKTLFLGLYKQMVVAGYSNHKEKLRQFVDWIFIGLQVKNQM